MKKVVRTTTTAHIPKKPIRYLDDKLTSIFQALRSILKAYEDKLEVKADREFHYELWTNRGYRIKSSRPRSRRGIAFASVIAFKNHIGFYFLPLSSHPTLMSNAKPELRSFSCGLYTFHFDTLEPIVAKQLEELVNEGWNFYKKKGLV